MIDPNTTRRWLYRSLFAGLAVLAVFLQILPVSIEPGALSLRRIALALSQLVQPAAPDDVPPYLLATWPGPDLILALVMAWGIRRPDYLPAALVGALLLMADLILQRPPGLWAALVVLALELLRARNHLWRDLPCPAEWAVISAVMTAVVIAYWLVLSLLFVRHAAIGLYLIQLLGTILTYPLVVLVSTRVLGVRSPAPGAFIGLRGRS